MNGEITDSKGQLLGRTNKIENFEGLAPSPQSKDGESSIIKKWFSAALSIKTDKSKYKQVSAKGYQLK